MNRSKENRALHRGFLGYRLKTSEIFEERSSAGRRLRCVKAGQASARRQAALGWPNLARAWEANRRKSHVTQVLKEQKERTLDLEVRRRMLACNTQVLRRIQGCASVNASAPSRYALRRL